jgi:hypothetical protein
MPTYYLLSFRASRLVRSDEIEAENPLEAATAAAQRAGGGYAELWAAKGGKIATYRPRDDSQLR